MTQDIFKERSECFLNSQKKSTKMNKNDDLMKIKDKQKVDGASILIYTEESLFKVVSLDLLKPQQGEEEQLLLFDIFLALLNSTQLISTDHQSKTTERCIQWYEI